VIECAGAGSRHDFQQAVKLVDSMAVFHRLTKFSYPCC